MTADVGREVEAADLSALDWDVACEYYAHEERGDGPAVWAVLTAAICPHAPTRVRFFCSACWAYRNSVGIVQCRKCFVVVPAMSNVLRVERIRPPSSP